MPDGDFVWGGWRKPYQYILGEAEDMDRISRKIAEVVNTMAGNLSEDQPYMRAYSGRGMYGKYCLGVSVGRYEMNDLLKEFKRNRIPEPSKDALGMGAILYWQNIPHDPKIHINHHVKDESVDHGVDALAEAKRQPEATYFPSYTAALDAARAKAEREGYAIDENDWNTRVTHGYPGRPAEGETTNVKIGLSRVGKGGKSEAAVLVIAVYGMKQSFELTSYISKVPMLSARLRWDKTKRVGESVEVTEAMRSVLSGEFYYEKVNNPRRQGQSRGNKGSESQYALRVYKSGKGGEAVGWIIPIMGTKGKTIGYSFHYDDPHADGFKFYAFTYGSMKKALDALKNEFLGSTAKVTEAMRPVLKRAVKESVDALTEAKTVEFSIMSKDYDGMEAAYQALPKRLANMMLGSGFNMASKMRDHGFECKNESDMQAIVAIYKKTLGGSKVTVKKHTSEAVQEAIGDPYGNLSKGKTKMKNSNRGNTKMGNSNIQFRTMIELVEAANKIEPLNRRRRTYTLVNPYYAFHVMRFEVLVHPTNGNTLAVNIYLESVAEEKYNSELRLPHLIVGIGKPMFGVMPEQARWVWNMLVKEYGWRQKK